MLKLNVTTIIIGIVILASIAMNVVLFVLMRDMRKELRDTRVELNAKTIGVQELKDAEGKLYYRIEEYNKSNRELRNSKDSIEIKLLNEMKLNGIRMRQIEKLQYALMESIDTLHSSVRDSVFVIDSIAYNKYATFNNGYLKAEVYLASNASDVELVYNYSAELYMYDSWTKPKFFLWRWLGFKGKTQQFDFKCSDPNADIKVLRSISTKK